MMLTTGIKASRFTPKTLTVKGWWTAKNPAGNGVLPSNGTQLSTFADLSGNGFDWTQGSVPLQPTFVADAGSGLPAINFALQYFTRPYTAALNGADMSIFIVCSLTTNSNQFKSILTSRVSTPTTKGYILYAEPNTPPASNAWSFWVGNNSASTWVENDGATLSTGSLVLLRAFTNVGSNSFYVNGTAYNNNPSTAYVANDTNGMWLGTGESNTFPFVGRLREMCIFDYTLNPARQAALSNYFRTQWGTSIS